MQRFLLVLLLFKISLAGAQFNYTLDQTVPVQDGNRQALSFPWAGGLNAVQFNTIELNGDGRADLMLYDRMANKVLTFLNLDNRYAYAPDYEGLFPDDLTNWVLLRDFNCDGLKDLFTGDILGIKVYMNTTSNGDLSWQRVLFYSGFPNSPKQPVILTKGFTQKVNLQIQNDDLPAIVDADNDGDLDIFSFRFGGNSGVEYHRNFSQERYGTCDSLDFERITQTWGNFRECFCGSFAFNNENCSSNGGGKAMHAAGKALSAFDANGDGTLDLVFSEAECNSMFLLPNEGDVNNPIINQVLPFPATDPIQFETFPAGYREDVNFDGVTDFLATPNIFSKPNVNVNLSASSYLYLNNGSNTAPQLTFNRNNFLQDQMIDVGDNSVPAFIDYEGDGDQDLFISTNAQDGTGSRIYLYENVGSTDTPVFRLGSADFGGFAASDFYNLKIQFTDINRDGRRDLVFSATRFSDGTTRLYYLLNNGASPLSFAATPQVTPLTLSFNENVYVADATGDGLADALVGRGNGALELWTNSGSASVPVFTLSNAAFLGFSSSVLRQNLVTHTADVDGNGTIDLIIGDQNGRINFVSDYQRVNAADEIPALIFNAVEETYQEKNLGGRLWPVAVNLFNSNKPAIVTGNILGGLYLLRNDDTAPSSEPLAFSVYPNPARKSDEIIALPSRSGTLQIYSMLGQQLTTPVTIEAGQPFSVNLSPYSSGIYLFTFRAGGNQVTKRVILR